MTYLDFQRLAAIDPQKFQQENPFPWINPEGLLTPDEHQQLLSTLPDVSLSQRCIGVARAHGQQSHDRFTLEYQDDFFLAPRWKIFIAELRGKKYQTFLHRLFKVNSLELSLFVKTFRSWYSRMRSSRALRSTPASFNPLSKSSNTLASSRIVEFCTGRGLSIKLSAAPSWRTGRECLVSVRESGEA